MNKKIGIILVGTIVVVFFLYKGDAAKIEAPLIEQKVEQKTEVVAPKPAVKAKVVTPQQVAVVPEIPRLVVRYTDQGFSPSVREVNRGEEVTFINNSSKGMRIASFEKNGQPAYNGMSQPKTVSQGAEFKFVFLQTGSWNYRNLNNESHTGIVVVK